MGGARQHVQHQPEHLLAQPQAGGQIAPLQGLGHGTGQFRVSPAAEKTVGAAQQVDAGVVHQLDVEIELLHSAAAGMAEGKAPGQQMPPPRLQRQLVARKHDIRVPVTDIVQPGVGGVADIPHPFPGGAGVAPVQQLQLDAVDLVAGNGAFFNEHMSKTPLEANCRKFHVFCGLFPCPQPARGI